MMLSVMYRMVLLFSRNQFAPFGDLRGPIPTWESRRVKVSRSVVMATANAPSMSFCGPWRRRQVGGDKTLLRTGNIAGLATSR
jgi:hypothetical protein